MPTLIKITIISLLILAMLLTVGCNKDKKENSSSDNFSDTSSVIEQPSYTESSTTTQPSTNTPSDNGTISGGIIIDEPSTQVSQESTSSSSSQTGSFSSGTSSHLDTTTPQQAETYKNTVKNLLDNIKAGEFEQVKANMIVEDDASHSLGFDEVTINRVKKIFEKLDYKITSAKYLTDYEGQVTIKISALNFKKIFLPYMQESIKLTRSGKEYTEKQLNKKLEQAFETSFEENAKVVTTKVSVHIFKTKDGWMVRDSLHFARACLGGANSINAVIEDAGKIIEEQSDEKDK